MYMGRWSRLVAPVFLEWLSVPSSGRWLEVGSGSGELTRAILSGCDPASVVGVDPSAGLVETARGVVRDDRMSFEVGGAEEMWVQAEDFDAVVSGLVLNFIPDMWKRGLRGWCVLRNRVGWWRRMCGIMRRFGDVAVALDAEAGRFDEGVREPLLCEPGALTGRFEGAGAC